MLLIIMLLMCVIDDCNETRDFLPCNDGSCYLKEQRCDGVMQCEDGVDEMGCKYILGLLFVLVHHGIGGSYVTVHR